MPRLVRRQSLAERIKDYLNPHDWLIWISEELESSEYPWGEWAYPAGAIFNFIFVISRANIGSRVYDDVFDDDGNSSGGGFFSHLASFSVLLLTILSITNAFYTFLRKRAYRLFEKPVEGAAPNTPSAHRVRVDSSPNATITSSPNPIRLLSNLLSPAPASSRAHPDSSRDVWEISIWDPTPLNLKLFCAFSPGHVILYHFFLPVAPSDPRPSTTVATALVLAALMSLQLGLLHSRFIRQAGDNAIIQREVLHEYDAKYVNPLAHPLVRDVGTQFDDEEHTFDACDTYPEAVVLRRGFSTHANPKYAGLVDPGGVTKQVLTTPGQISRIGALKTPAKRDSLSPLQRMTMERQQQQQQQQMQQQQAQAQAQTFRSSMGGGPAVADGGHLGVYSHAQSPLKKRAQSSGFAAPDARARQSVQGGLMGKRTGYVSTAQGPGRSRFV